MPAPMSPFRAIAISRFRDHAAKEIRWIEKMGGHLWLTRHGKNVAAVIPFHEVEALERLLGWDTEGYARDMEERYVAWKRAKAALGDGTAQDDALATGAHHPGDQPIP